VRSVAQVQMLLGASEISTLVRDRSGSANVRAARAPSRCWVVVQRVAFTAHAVLRCQTGARPE
jgi:hypothetical protein